MNLQWCVAAFQGQFVVALGPPLQQAFKIKNQNRFIYEKHKIKKQNFHSQQIAYHSY